MPPHVESADDQAAPSDRLERAERRVAQLEALLVERSREAAATNERLRAATSSLREIYRTMPGALFLIDADGMIEDLNDAACALLGYRHDELIGRAAERIFDDAGSASAIDVAAVGVRGVRVERTFRGRDGGAIPVLFSATRLPPAGGDRRGPSLVCVAVDLRERKRLERELQLAQKLESLGRLAAGVAHEINTPVQFVLDSVTFARDASARLLDLVAAYRRLREQVRAGALAPAVADARAAAADDAADLEFSMGNLPVALDEALDGLRAVADIVRSLRAYAHPDRDAMTAAAVNDIVASTLRLARNEYADIADVETDLGELPPVTCHAGEVGQALLNVIVNAAHAIRDQVGIDGRRGVLRVRTRRRDGRVLIAVADNGTGIPDRIRDRIFDPFFTTRAAGGGTGQGLAIARAVVRDRHGGELTFVTTPGVGTTFELALPIEQTPTR